MTDIPEMMNEGQKNTLKFIESNISDEELDEQIEILKVLCISNDYSKIIKGWDKLPEKAKETLSDTLKATEYLLNRALEIKEARKNIVDYQPENKENATLMSSRVNGSLTSIDKAGAGLVRFSKNKDDVVFVSLTLEDDKIQLSRDLTQFDKCVLNAACSLYYENVTTFTIDQLYRRIYGIPDFTKITSTMIAPIIESLDALQCRRIVINKENPSNDIDKVVYKDYLLPLKYKFVKYKNGTIKSAYTIIDKPRILDYSESIGHIRTYPLEVLDTGKVVKNNPDNRVLFNYLLTEFVEKGKSVGHIKKTFYGMLRDCGYEHPESMDRKIISRKINYLSKYLEHFKKQGIIKDVIYKDKMFDKKTGKYVKGFEANFDKRQKKINTV